MHAICLEIWWSSYGILHGQLLSPSFIPVFFQLLLLVFSQRYNSKLKLSPTGKKYLCFNESWKLSIESANYFLLLFSSFRYLLGLQLLESLWTTFRGYPHTMVWMLYRYNSTSNYRKDRICHWQFHMNYCALLRSLLYYGLVCCT